MSIWLLSHLSDSPGNRIFTEEGLARGHRVRLVKPAARGWQCSNRECQVLGPEPPRLIFTRLGSSASESDLYSVRVAETAGIPILNSYQALRTCRDKVQTYLSLQAAGVPFPDTLWLAQEWTWDEVLHFCGPPPHVLKFAVGTKGQGVVLSESRRSFTSIVESLRTLGAPFLVQRFLNRIPGRDTRVLVVGGKACGAAVRQSQNPEEFRSNLYLGGVAQSVQPSEEQVRVAEAAAQALGLEVAGVDLLDDDDGPSVVEVNGSPGLEASPFFVKHLWDYLEETHLSARPKEPA